MAPIDGIIRPLILVCICASWAVMANRSSVCGGAAAESSEEEVLDIVMQHVGKGKRRCDTSEDEADKEEPRCELCEAPIPCGQVSKSSRMGFRVLDKRCFNSLRCLERSTASRPKLRSQVEHMRREEPLKFRAMVAKLRTESNSSRNKIQREDTVKFLETLAEERSEVRYEKYLLFTKRQFIQWYKHNEGMTEDEAVQKWRADKLSGDVYKEHAKNGLKLAVQMPVEIGFEDRLSRKREKENPDADMAKPMGKFRKPNQGQGLGGHYFSRTPEVVGLDAVMEESSDDEPGGGITKARAAVTPSTSPRDSKPALGVAVARRLPTKTPKAPSAPSVAPSAGGGPGDEPSDSEDYDPHDANIEDKGAGKKILPIYTGKMMPAQFILFKKQLAKAGSPIVVRSD